MPIGMITLAFFFLVAGLVITDDKGERMTLIAVIMFVTCLLYWCYYVLFT